VRVNAYIVRLYLCLRLWVFHLGGADRMLIRDKALFSGTGRKNAKKDIQKPKI